MSDPKRAKFLRRKRAFVKWLDSLDSAELGEMMQVVDEWQYDLHMKTMLEVVGSMIKTLKNIEEEKIPGWGKGCGAARRLEDGGKVDKPARAFRGRLQRAHAHRGRGGGGGGGLFKRLMLILTPRLQWGSRRHGGIHAFEESA